MPGLSASSVSAQATRDSAGIRIVENATPVWSAATSWRVDPKPTLVLGSSEGPDTRFRGIGGASRMSDGRIAVSDMDAGTIRLFDQQGKFVQTVGHGGRDQGAFSRAIDVKVGPGDVIVGLDALGDEERQLNVFSPDGKWIRAERLRVNTRLGAEGRVRTGAWGADGWWIERLYIPGPPGPQAHRVDSVTLTLVHPDGIPIAVLGRMPESESGHPTQPLPPLFRFGPFGSADIYQQRVAYGFGDRYQITVYNRSGHPTTIIHRDWQLRAVTPAELEDFKNDYATPEFAGGAPFPPGVRSDRLGNLRQMNFANSFPAFDRLVYDRIGNLWVREPAVGQYFVDGMKRVVVRSQTYSVFDSTGQWLGDVATPAGFGLREIGADYMLGITLADDGVERLSMLHLVKPAGAKPPGPKPPGAKPPG